MALIEKAVAESKHDNARENYAMQMRGQQVDFESCPSIRTLLSSARQDIERQARGGDVVARYFFAMWPPDLRMETAPLLAQAEWELLAKDFTFQNIDEGEPLGLLALGRSYQGSVFTPHNMALGIGLLMAAVNCGLQHERTERFLESMANHVDEGTPYYTTILYGQVELALTIAKQAGMECQTPINSP